MKSMKLIMENFNKFLKEKEEEAENEGGEEAENKGGEKPVIKYTIIGGGVDDEKDFDIVIDETSLKPEHKPKSPYDQPLTVGKMMQYLIKKKDEEGNPILKLKKPYPEDFNMATEQASILKRHYLPDGKTLKDVIDMWADRHGYKVEHPESANDSKESEEPENTEDEA